MHSLNLAARAGRWSAQHWKTATFGWLAFVVAALVVGQALGTKNIDPNDTVPGESGEMTRILDAGFKQPAGESVLIQSTTLRAEYPRFQAAVDDVLRRVSAIDVVTNVRSPLEEENRGQISRDRRSALIQFDIRGDADEATEKVDPVLAAVADTQRAHPELFIGAFGDASANKALEEQFAKDLEKAGYLSLPVTLIILVLAFGALVAAAATSGRAVLISGITVMIAMAGMFFTGDPTFSSFALATIIVVAMAVLGSLTVLPALLAKLGDRVNWVRIPFFGRAQARSGGRVWGAVLDRVLRRPLVSAIAAAALLVAL